MNDIGSCKDVIVIPKATTKKSLKIYSKINDKGMKWGTRKCLFNTKEDYKVEIEGHKKTRYIKIAYTVFLSAISLNLNWLSIPMNSQDIEKMKKKSYPTIFYDRDRL